MVASWCGSRVWELVHIHAYLHTVACTYRCKYACVHTSFYGCMQVYHRATITTRRARRVRAVAICLMRLASSQQYLSLWSRLLLPMLMPQCPSMLVLPPLCELWSMPLLPGTAEPTSPLHPKPSPFASIHRPQLDDPSDKLRGLDARRACARSTAPKTILRVIARHVFSAANSWHDNETLMGTRAADSPLLSTTVEEHDDGAASSDDRAAADVHNPQRPPWWVSRRCGRTQTEPARSGAVQHAICGLYRHG